MRNFIQRLRALPRVSLPTAQQIGVVTVAFVLVGLISIVEFATGFEISFALFYVLPISLVAWYAGRNAALAVGIASALSWEIAHLLAGRTYSSPVVPYWNTATRLGFFLIIVLLLSLLRQTLEREQALSRTDALTGAANRRGFEELTRGELAKANRYTYPLTVAYIDVDNFKDINDRYGHAVGDELLRAVTQTLQTHLRASDTVARLGGDEFGLLLPAADATVARRLVDRTHRTLTEKMEARGWPVTFSIGVLTCVVTPTNSAELLRRVDALMYAAKAKGKDAINYSIHTG